MAGPTANNTEPRHGWLISLAFWLCLLAAAGVYAAIALSPKLLEHLELKSRYHANQVHLVGLEQQIDDLQRVVDALKNDPQFAAELARVEFDASRPGDERIPVDPSHTLQAQLQAPPRPPDVNATLPWYAPLIRALAAHRRLRLYALVAAAALVIVAFTFLQESQAPQLQSGASSLGQGLQSLARRYRK